MAAVFVAEHQRLSAVAGRRDLPVADRRRHSTRAHNGVAAAPGARARIEFVLAYRAGTRQGSNRDVHRLHTSGIGTQPSADTWRRRYWSFRETKRAIVECGARYRRPLPRTGDRVL